VQGFGAKTAVENNNERVDYFNNNFTQQHSWRMLGPSANQLENRHTLFRQK
jgi:hypothetical protein